LPFSSAKSQLPIKSGFLSFLKCVFIVLVF